MNSIKKIGTKQWMMIALSLSLAASSLFIPLEERVQDPSSFSMAANTVDNSVELTAGLNRS